MLYMAVYACGFLFGALVVLYMDISESLYRKVYINEKRKRVYYQSIVYDVCNKLNEVNEVFPSRVVCGTADSPSTEVQDSLDNVLAHRTARREGEK